MSILRTWPSLESPSISLPLLISRHTPLNHSYLTCLRRAHHRRFSVALHPIHHPLVAVFSTMTDTRSNSDGVLNTVDKTYCEIVVIRHGETEWNANKRIQGHLDIDLNDIGRQQAVAVAERLSKESKINAVYSSDLKRALKTAETIASRCGGIQVIQDPNLRERHLGDLQGVVYGEAPTIKTKAHEALQSHRRDLEIPGGGESLNQLYERCTASLQTIATKHRGERVVVVTHGGVIRALHQRASLGKSHRAGRILNVSVNVLHLSDSDDWVIKSWGDVSHLNGAGYLDSGFGGDRTSG